MERYQVPSENRSRSLWHGCADSGNSTVLKSGGVTCRTASGPLRLDHASSPTPRRQWSGMIHHARASAEDCSLPTPRESASSWRLTRERPFAANGGRLAVGTRPMTHVLSGRGNLGDGWSMIGAVSPLRSSGRHCRWPHVPNFGRRHREYEDARLQGGGLGISESGGPDKLA